MLNQKSGLFEFRNTLTFDDYDCFKTYLREISKFKAHKQEKKQHLNVKFIQK